MEDNPEFLGTIAEALEKRRLHLDTSVMPKLKEHFQIFHTAFQSMYNVLLRKGLIHEDPYKYDQKISEVSNPPEGPFLESEKAEQLSIRLSTFESQLDFLTNYYQFSTEFLTMQRIKRLVSFVKYIRWDSLSLASPHLNTRVLAEYLDKIKKGTDTLSSGIIADSHVQIERAFKQILSVLKDITLYHREQYKLMMRKKLLSQINLNPEAVRTRRQETMKVIKRKFALEMGDTPFYPELFEEILDEDYSQDSEKIRSELIGRIEVKDEGPKRVKQETSFKQILLEAVRLLSGAGYHFDEALKKLSENSMILNNRKMSFMERFRAWLLKVFQSEGSSQIYEVEYFDVVTSATKSEKINFTEFMEEAAKKSRLFSILGIRTSPTYRKLEAADEEQIFMFLSRNLEETQLIYRRLNALDTYFKSEIPKEERSRLRGIKIELNGIKNSIMKTNQKKHEYVAKKEEMEQMKKLGINPETLV